MPGMQIHGASLLQTKNESTASNDRKFVVFYDFLLGKGAASRYWKQQADRTSEVGTEFLVTARTSVAIVSTTTNGIVLNVDRIRIAHVALSVSTNDFDRPFTPSNRQPSNSREID